MFCNNFSVAKQNQLVKVGDKIKNSDKILAKMQSDPSFGSLGKTNSSVT